MCFRTTTGRPSARGTAGRRREPLDRWAGRTVVLAWPREGVAVGREVGEVLGVPMDVIVTREIGYPPQPELGAAAVAEGLPQPVYDAGLLGRLGLAPEDLSEVAAAEEAEVGRRVRIYRAGNPLPPVAGRCVMVVDGGLATGSTACAALRSLRTAGRRTLSSRCRWPRSLRLDRSQQKPTSWSSWPPPAGSPRSGSGTRPSAS